MKLISIILTLVILNQSVFVHANDLLAITDLVEHYEFHQKKYNDDFLTFVSKHYGSQKKSHNDSNKDEKSSHDNLPFQHANHHSSLTLYFEQQTVSTTDRPVITEADVKTLKNEALTHNLFSSGVFQPPKQA